MTWYKKVTVNDLADGPLNTWSFSGLKAFEDCPLRRFLEKVKGHRQESGPAATRGSQYHDAIEQFIRGSLDELPKMGDIPRAFIEKAKEQFCIKNIHLEEKWYIDKEWNTVTKDEQWGVFIIDYFELESETSACIVDWKTGKSRNNEMKHTEQLLFYAISAFARYPDLEYVSVAACYIDENFLGLEKGYHRDQLAAIKKQLTKRALIMTTATHFTPHPSKQNCRWCDLKTMKHPETGNALCEWGVL